MEKDVDLQAGYSLSTLLIKTQAIESELIYGLDPFPVLLF
jgi:hypothetical protein